MRRSWSRLVAVLAQMFCAWPALLVAQKIILLEQTRAPETILPSAVDSVQAPADTTAPPQISIASALDRFRSRLDAGYHAAPVHPYFRDEQRVINDMRRLVLLVDQGAVRGVESVPELAAVAQNLPVTKQTAIIRMAAAGSIANVTAENIMKQVRRHRVNFVRVEVERVQVQTNWRGNYLSLTRSLDRQTYTVSQPRLRATYAHTEFAEFSSHQFSFTPLPRVSLYYMRRNELDIFSAVYVLRGGFSLVSYDYTRKVTVLALRLQAKRNWAGVFLIKNHLAPAADWWRFDVWLVL